MYRRSLQQKMETENQYQFLQRLSALPVMETAVSQLAVAYTNTKSRNALLKYTFEVTEAGVTKVANTAKPIVNRFEKPIGSLDNFACSQLTKLESNYPIIRKPTGEVVEETKNLLAPTVERVVSVKDYGVNTVTSVRDYGVNKATAVKDYSVNTVNGVKTYTLGKLDSARRYGTDTLSSALDTQYGKVVLGAANNLLDTTDKYVDYYLPEDAAPAAAEADVQKDVQKAEKENANPVIRTMNLSSKVRTRMYSRAMRDFHNLQRRSKETIDSMTFTVDLIQYAKNHVDGVTGRVSAAKDRVAYIWEEINKTEEQVATDEAAGEAKTGTKTMERRLIATARHLTLRLKRGVAAVSATASSVSGRVLPTAVQERLAQAMRFTEELCQSFAKAQNLQDLPMSLLDRAKDKLGDIKNEITHTWELMGEMRLFDWMARSLNEKKIRPAADPKENDEPVNVEETAEIEMEEIPPETTTTEEKTAVEEMKAQAIQVTMVVKEAKSEAAMETAEDPEVERAAMTRFEPQQQQQVGGGRYRGKKSKKPRDVYRPYMYAQSNGADDLDFAEEFVAPHCTSDK